MKTEDWLPVITLADKNKLYFDREMKTLVETCDKYPDIAEFVRVLVNGLLTDKDSEEYRIADALNYLVWKIVGLDIQNDLNNTCHYQGNWLCGLNSFIGNYFLDDLCFSLTRSNYYNQWEASTNNENGIQNPLALIAAAKDNYRFYRKVEGMALGKEKRQCMKSGMESSGEVERYLREIDKE